MGLIEAARNAGVKRFINTSTTSAAAPENSADPSSLGIPRTFWPHLCNVIAIENRLRERPIPRFRLSICALAFCRRRYALGVLPILVPRLKTHLVPWVAGGRTSAHHRRTRHRVAFALAATAQGLTNFESFNIVGPENPTIRQIITLLHEEYRLPRPHFGVPFALAYPFAWLIEKLDPLLPWEPLITRSIIHLLEETGADNIQAEKLLGYRPAHSWREAIRAQMAEMALKQARPMSMARPVTP
jgi:nucleoside-diphosphate-sugar epimerase